MTLRVQPSVAILSLSGIPVVPPGGNPAAAAEAGHGLPAKAIRTEGDAMGPLARLRRRRERREDLRQLAAYRAARAAGVPLDPEFEARMAALDREARRSR